MSEVSASDKNAYAAAKRVSAKPVLNVEPLDEIATANVDGTPTYPLTSITVDNTSADWLDGDENLLFRIEEATGAVIAWGVLNKDNTANTFFPDVKSNGDFGYATNEGITIEDDDVIRIYRNHPNWAMISRVTAAGIQNKRWNKTYTNEGTTPPPVVIMGHDQQADIDTGTNKATFSFDASDSYDWISGASITGFAYTLPGGAVVTGGAVNTDSVTFTIAAGIYTVKLVITSSSGISQTAYRTIYANDNGNNKSFGEANSIESINADSTDIDGWEGQFTVLGDVTSEIYPGAKCHWFVPVFYDGSRLTDNDAFIDVFIGYLTEINVRADSSRVKRTTLTFKSPLKLAKLLPSATQTIEEVKTASEWTQVINGLSDPAYAAFYILQFHTTMLDNHDFLHESSIRELRRRVFGFPADNINAHLQIDGQIMRGNVGCRSDGTITVTQEPSLQNASGRAARDEKFTWTEDSVRPRLTITPTFRPKIAYLIMGAVAYDGNPNKPMIAYAAKAPGKAQAQGVTKTNMPDISITVSGGAAELYGVIGHMFALLNNPLSKLDILIAAMFDIADPADPDWHILNISESDYLPVTMDLFGVRWSATMRMRPIRVTRQWTRTRGTWIKSIMQQNRIESSGQPGVFHPTYKGELQPYIDPLSGWLTGLNITMPDINIDFDVAGLLPTSGDWNVAWAFNNFGLSGYSEDWNGDNPSYASAGVDLAGDVVAEAFDGSGDGSGYLITQIYDATNDIYNYNVYENPDVSADPTDWSLDHTIQFLDNAGFPFFNGQPLPINIESNASQTVISWLGKDTSPGQSQFEHKPAAGAWQAAVDVGGTGTGIQFGEAFAIAPLVQDGTKTWVIGMRDSPGLRNISVFRQAVVGGVWTIVANHPGTASGKIPTIARSGTDIFVSIIRTATATLYRVDDGTETWTDITPDTTYVPRRQNAITINGADIWAICTNNDGDKKLFQSANSGTNWTDRGETKYDWLYRLGSDDIFVLGGDNLLDVTINDFGTFHSRLAQWGKIGSIGFIKDIISGGLV